MQHLVESLKHLIKGLLSFDSELKGFQPRGPIYRPSISSANIGAQSSGSIREAYYKGASRPAVLPWPEDRK